MTQTTAERIATLINEGVDCSCDGGWTHESVVGVLEVAAVIAAEIDALARERDEARAEVARLTPLSEIHDAWRELHEGKESPSEESVVRFIEFAHAAAGRAYEAAKGTP